MVEQILAAYDKLLKQANPKTRNFDGYLTSSRNDVTVYAKEASRPSKLHEFAEDRIEERHEFNPTYSDHTYNFNEHPFAGRLTVTRNKNGRSTTQFDSQPVFAHQITADAANQTLQGTPYRVSTIFKGKIGHKLTIFKKGKKRDTPIGEIHIMPWENDNHHVTLKVKSVDFKPLIKVLFANLTSKLMNELPGR